MCIQSLTVHRPAPMHHPDFLDQVVEDSGALGLRADEAHVSTQHIEELRKLVDAHLADEGSYTGDTRIIRRSPVEHSILFGIDPHAAELDHVEAAAVQTIALLRVEDRPAILQKDQ